MKKILVSSVNEEVNQLVREVCKDYADYFDPVFFSNTEDAISFIDYEIPEIKIIDFASEKIDGNKILSAIHADPWLHNGGIIAIVKNSDELEALEERKDPNILIVQTLRMFKQNFGRLLRVLWRNQKFLFNRGMQELLGGQEYGSFVCENNPFDIRLYTSFLVNYMYYTNRITDEMRFALQTAFMELLTNALEHGNCGITYQEKTECLMSGGNILDLISEKLKNPELAKRRIFIEYKIGQETSEFSIKDDGDGFDWKNCVSKEMDFSEETHGRGISMSKTFVGELHYNEKGNMVSFAIDNQRNTTNTIPGVMTSFDPIDYDVREIVCRQNEPSNDLFFIVKGKYGVYVNGRLVTVLTPNDMFIGEMAFLLDDRRSATVMSAGNGKLIRIPKVAFLNLIRKNPHYGIFLSKLLAQRVQRQTQQTLELSKKANE